ncbi:unnamed protein product [Cuscuta europaea]|uniref:Myb-like domain-containing protein n=1 Tax=Cuscuta europaea TaxID=41803 RepID=A0A9P0ZZ34_CUSEU|nr:unnamed protein product [Cuscuta europaea]
MLETSVLVDNPRGGIAAPAAEAVAELQSGGGGEDGDRSSGGNRWPHEETLALLKIRSEMDLAFRDSTLKAPLWEQVSRKMEESGYKRSAKKCKEKFENIYKYHKRTKEGRSGRQNGKNYRFFDQLEVLDNLQSNKTYSDDSKDPTELGSPTPMAMVRPNTNIVQDFRTHHHLISQTKHNLTSADVISASTSTTYSSGKESGSCVSRKRQMAGFFEKLMTEVLEKQENLQKKFLEALERCERDRMAREEAWKREETERMKREQEFLAQERAISEAKDAALIAFLQKIAKQPIPVNSITPLEKDPEIQEGNDEEEININNEQKENGSGERTYARWPKAEIEALIRFRTKLDMQYNENGSKGPLWEDISSEMKKLGYDRNAKRCKEKWENINKYYRKVKESNKRRPGDSKTCPYFHILDSLYQNKSKRVVELSSTTPDNPHDFNMKAGEMLMHIINQNQKQYREKQDVRRTTNGFQSQENDEEGESEDRFQIGTDRL